MFPQPRFIDSNGIRLAIYEQGQGQPVILLHGFPELAYSWRHQFPALAAAGYRAIAPDQRGYGLSDVPDGVAAYRVTELIADVHGLLDALELDTATFVGHDWGAILLWHMAVLAPERIERMAILNIPHYGRPPGDPIAFARQQLGDDFYIVNFQDSDEADRTFATDPRRFIRCMMRRREISRARFEELPPAHRVVSLLRKFHNESPRGDDLLDATELDYYTAAFARTGFTGAINWYRNWTWNWERLAGIDPRTAIPTLFIGAHDDVVVGLHHVDNMRSLCSDLTVHMLDDCGHWTQQEHPERVNRLLLDWLQS